jgi:putative phage-type endonuclease
MTSRDAWLDQRRTGIGGSDVAAILGLSKWKTPLAVYQEKRGEVEPQPDNPAMRWGRYLEPVVRQAYADETGREVRVLPDMLRHPKHHFMIANIDGFTSDQRIFEAKTARTADGWGEPGTDQIPQPYLLQVQHYLAVAQFAVADVAVLIGGSDFRLYEVPADTELQQMIIEAEAQFWDCVQKGEPPAPISYADMQARYGRSSTPGSVLATEEVQAAVMRLHDVRTRMAQLEAEEEHYKALVMGALGDKDTLVDAQGTVMATWKASAPAKRFDSAAFRVMHPDLYEQFVKLGEPSRRFLLK